MSGEKVLLDRWMMIQQCDKLLGVSYAIEPKVVRDAVCEIIKQLRTSTYNAKTLTESEAGDE